MVVTALTMVVSAAISVVNAGWVAEDWGGATVPLLVLLTTAPPIVVEKWARIRIPFHLQLLYAVLLIAGPYVGEYFGLYHAWDPWDKVVHFYSGFAIAFGLVFALGIALRRHALALPPWLEAVLIIAAKASVALFWEVAEFFWDQILGTSAQDDNFDTMTDMMLGTLPGFFIAGALVLHRTTRELRYLDHLLHADALQEDQSGDPQGRDSSTPGRSVA